MQALIAAFEACSHGEYLSDEDDSDYMTIDGCFDMREIAEHIMNNAKCLCIVGCSVNGLCPIHGADKSEAQAKGKI